MTQSLGKLLAIIGGMTYAPKALETIEIHLMMLVIEWFKVDPTAIANQQTIGQLSIRQRYEVNIIAIIKINHQKNSYTWT